MPGLWLCAGALSGGKGEALPSPPLATPLSSWGLLCLLSLPQCSRSQGSSCHLQADWVWVWLLIHSFIKDDCAPAVRQAQ